MFKNASGALFGIGTQANKPWWVDIIVSGPTVTPGGPTKDTHSNRYSWWATVTPIAGAAYDFAAQCLCCLMVQRRGCINLPRIRWRCQGLRTQSEQTPNLNQEPLIRVLAFSPSRRMFFNGYIQGFYPAFRVQSGGPLPLGGQLRRRRHQLLCDLPALIIRRALTRSRPSGFLMRDMKACSTQLT
jgi:hypothetical protein